MKNVCKICNAKNACKNCTIQSQAVLKLTEEQIELLSSNSVFAKFRKGDPLIKQGLLSTNVVFLSKGLAKIHITGPYHEQIVRIAKSPCFLGLTATIGKKINQYSVTAIENIEVCLIDINKFNYLLKKNSDFVYEIMVEICSDELEAYYRCANRTQKQTRGKIADVLLEFADFYSSKKYKIPLTQEDFGNLVDSSRESVSRVLNEFEKDGIIHYLKKQVEILNKEKLLMISMNG